MQPPISIIIICRKEKNVKKAFLVIGGMLFYLEKGDDKIWYIARSGEMGLVDK